MPPPAAPPLPSAAPTEPVAQVAGLAQEERLEPWLDVWAHVRSPSGGTVANWQAEVERQESIPPRFSSGADGPRRKDGLPCGVGRRERREHVREGSQVMAKGQATVESSVEGGPQRITGAFLAISDSPIAARDNSRAEGGLRAAGPPPEMEEAPPGARRGASGGSEGGVDGGGEAIPCQYVTKRASGPCADLSQVACPLCSVVGGLGCDCGLRFRLAHASRVKDTGKHGVDQEVVPAHRAEPLDAVTTTEAGTTPLDLPPREVNPVCPVPTPTMGAVPPGPPLELILRQYTEHQDPKECSYLSKVDCPTQAWGWHIV